MCPLRIILVFFSATLAGYFAWKTFRSSPESEDKISYDTKVKVPLDNCRDRAFGFKKAIGDGFWVLVDMASGRYLWRNLGVMKEGKKG